MRMLMLPMMVAMMLMLKKNETSMKQSNENVRRKIDEKTIQNGPWGSRGEVPGGPLGRSQGLRGAVRTCFGEVAQTFKK